MAHILVPSKAIHLTLFGSVYLVTTPAGVILETELLVEPAVHIFVPSNAIHSGHVPTHE